MPSSVASGGKTGTHFSPYRELDNRGGKVSKAGGGPRSLAKIRIAAAVKNQPYRNQHETSKMGGASQESDRSLEHRNETA